MGDRLREALGAWGPFDPANPVDDGLNQVQRMEIAAAARRVLDARPVRWCETHCSEAHPSGKSQCYAAENYRGFKAPVSACRIVSARLIIEKEPQSTQSSRVTLKGSQI